MSVTQRKKKPAKKTAGKRTVPSIVEALVTQGTKPSMPEYLKPMLCEKREKAFNGENWIFELKFDGYRIIAYLDQGKVTLYSRELQNYTQRYSRAVDILASLEVNAIIDGEMIALNSEGKPDFSE